MNRKGSFFGVIILVSIAWGVVYFGWQIQTSSEMHICRVCNRPIHAETRTVAMVDGKEIEFCCPACALSDYLQTGKKVQIVRFTDYWTHVELSPENAFLVKGSRVEPCIQHSRLLDRENQPVPLEFDRCSPSILAFGRREDAEMFMQEYGGALVTSGDISATYQR